MTIIKTKEASVIWIIKHNIHVGLTAEFFAPCQGIRIPKSGKLWILEFRIQLKESGIPLTIEFQNPSSNDKDWNPVPGIRNPRRRIRNPRPSWIPLHGAKRLAELVLEN